MEEFKCKFCNRELQSIKALRSHQGKCKQNPNYKGLSEKQKAHYRICAEHLCKSRRKGSFDGKENILAETCPGNFYLGRNL